jgi:HEPN domain-containing protein
MICFNEKIEKENKIFYQIGNEKNYKNEVIEKLFEKIKLDKKENIVKKYNDLEKEYILVKAKNKESFEKNIEDIVVEIKNSI